MELVFHKFTDRAVAEAWKSMETPSMSPFLHYDYLGYVYRFIRRFKPYRPRVACVEEDGEIMMMLAILISIDGSYCKLMGDIQGCGCADAVWKPSLVMQRRTELARFFFANIRRKIKLHRIREDSPLLAALPEDRAVLVHTAPCVSIRLQGSASEHIGGLSRSVRQNIRTAYNRMERDGIKYRAVFYDSSKPLSDTLWKQIMELYFIRLFGKYKRRKARLFFQRWRQRYKYFHLKHDTLSLRRLDNAFHAVLFDGERIMAFLDGLETLDGSILSVPRLAINPDYAFYSPGYVLLVELIRHMDSGCRLREIDLSRGDERYKTDMGGRVYFTRDYNLKKI